MTGRLDAKQPLKKRSTKGKGDFSGENRQETG